MTRPDLAHVPQADRGVCCQCAEPLDTRGPGVAVLVRGWRVNRARGGSSPVALPELLGQYLCADCLGKRRRGVSWDQVPLFEEP